MENLIRTPRQIMEQISDQHLRGILRMISPDDAEQKEEFLNFCKSFLFSERWEDGKS